MSEAPWTARDFLRAASEFERMTPQRDTWTEAHQESNAPRLVRLQRLRALAKAFDVQPGFESLWSGDFVAQRPFERYALLQKRVQSDCEARFPVVLQTARRPLSLRDVEWIYKRLFLFLTRHAYPMLDVNSGVLEASGFNLYALKTVDLALAPLPEAIQPLEELAGLAVAPEGRAFTEGELAAHGWPDANLAELDADWA